MKVFRLDDLDAERVAHDGAYLQFLRERNMSAGLYALPAGGTDPQKPHRQDEVYVVVSGRRSTLVGFVIGLLFKVLLFAALVGGLVYLVKRFTSSSSSKDW